MAPLIIEFEKQILKTEGQMPIEYAVTWYYVLMIFIILQINRKSFVIICKIYSVKFI